MLQCHGKSEWGDRRKEPLRIKREAHRPSALIYQQSHPRRTLSAHLTVSGAPLPGSLVLWRKLPYHSFDRSTEMAEALQRRDRQSLERLLPLCASATKTGNLA